MPAKSGSFVLDASALMAYYSAEAPGDRVKEWLHKAVRNPPTVFISVVSLAEVAMVVEKHSGLAASAAMLARTAQLPIEIVPLEYDSAVQAAHFQAVYSLPFASACAAVTALEKRRPLLTTDQAFEAVRQVIQVERLD